MFNSVQHVRDLCKKQGIAIAKLEKDCGFSNGYLNPKKMSKLPFDRAVIIGEYLGYSPDYILTGKKNTPAVIDKRTSQSNIELTSVEIELIKKFRLLDERGRSAVLNTLDHEYAALPGGKAAADPRRA